MANCSHDKTIGERISILEKFASRLEVSGYPVRVLARILRNGIINYSRIVEKKGEVKVMSTDLKKKGN